MFLEEHFNIVFNNLFSITNLPLGRSKMHSECRKLDLLHKWNRPPLIPPYKGRKLEILLPPLHKGRAGRGDSRIFARSLLYISYLQFLESHFNPNTIEHLIAMNFQLTIWAIYMIVTLTR